MDYFKYLQCKCIIIRNMTILIYILYISIRQFPTRTIDIANMDEQCTHFFLHNRKFHAKFFHLLRCSYVASYEVGCTKEGKLNGIRLSLYGDHGCSPTDSTLYSTFMYVDNAYYCPNWHIEGIAVMTDTPSTTFCRGPGMAPGIFIMETIMEHVANTMKQDPLVFKKMNFYETGQVCSIYWVTQKDEKNPAVSTKTDKNIFNICVKSIYNTKILNNMKFSLKILDLQEVFLFVNPVTL